jgi:hypothetical protein
MKLKDQIAEKKALIAKLEDLQAENQLLIKVEVTGHEQKMVRNILTYQNIDLGFRLEKQRIELRDMIQNFEGEYKMKFEKISRECNLNLPTMVARGQKYVEKHPEALGLAATIKDLLTKYELEKDTIEQEDKNDLYTSLHRLLNSNLAKK